VHLEQKDPQGQTLVKLPPQTVSADGGRANDYQNISTEVDYLAEPDNRAVTVSCPAVDISQYRDPPLTGPVIVNTRQPDGSLRGDTLLSSNIQGDQIAGNSQSFSYHANVAGSWSGTYHWFSSFTGYNDSGSFPSVPDFSVPVTYYTGGSPNPTNTGGIDHIFLSMYDGSDGAEATGNYYMHFHNKYEPSSWPEDSGSPYKVMGPDPDAASFPTPPLTYPWRAVNPVLTLIYPQTTINVAYQEPGIESVDAGVELGVDPVKVHFGISGNPTATFNVSQPLTANPPLQQYQETWAVYREEVARHKGHLDIYGTHGYTSTAIWRHDLEQGIVLNLYFPYPSTGSLAPDPPAGWNPPGYK
jgi:hypothetical protein